MFKDLNYTWYKYLKQQGQDIVRKPKRGRKLLAKSAYDVIPNNHLVAAEPIAVIQQLH